MSSYWNPIISEEDIPDNSQFVICPFKYPDDVVDDFAFIFEISGNITISGNILPGHLFDYCNPLLLNRQNSSLIKFDLSKFECLQIKIPNLLKDRLPTSQLIIPIELYQGIVYPETVVIPCHSDIKQFPDYFKVQSLTELIITTISSIFEDEPIWN